MKLFVFVAVLCALQVLEAKKYKVKLISVEKCDLPEEKMDKSKPVLYETSVRRVDTRSSVIRTNFTVLRALGPVMMNFRISRLGAAGAPVFRLERLGCRSPFTYQLVRVVRLRLDDDCNALPGSYLTDDINLQDFAWILSKVAVSSGKYVYDLEVCTSKGIAVCNSIVCDISETK